MSESSPVSPNPRLWRSGEPNESWRGGEDCAVLQVGDPHRAWNDVSCHDNNVPFLCQRDPAPYRLTE